MGVVRVRVGRAGVALVLGCLFFGAFVGGLGPSDAPVSLSLGVVVSPTTAAVSPSLSSSDPSKIAAMITITISVVSSG